MDPKQDWNVKQLPTSSRCNKFESSSLKIETREAKNGKSYIFYDGHLRKNAHIWDWVRFCPKVQVKFERNIHEKLLFLESLQVSHTAMEVQIDASFFGLQSTQIYGDCFNSSPPSAAYMRQWTGSGLVQIMACHLFGAKPLSKLMLVYCQLDP